MDLDTLSDRLFGRRLRLAVALWIWREADDAFYQQQLARELQLPQSNVRDELHDRLIPLGMIQPVPRVSGDRRQYYIRTASPLWRIIEAVNEVAGSASQAPNDPSPREIGSTSERQDQ